MLEKCTMPHACVFVPHECCTARACVVAGVRHVSVSLWAFCSGWVGGCLKGAGVLFSFPTRPPVEKSNPGEAEARLPPKGGGRGSAGVRSDVLSPSVKKRNAHAPAVRARMGSVVYVECERALRTHD